MKYVLAVFAILVFVNPVFAGDSPALVTNEYAHWNQKDPTAILSAEWDMDSGSLFRVGDQYWTGTIDSVGPNFESSTSTNSAVFRLINTEKKGDHTSFLLDVVGMSTTENTPAVSWDGVHVFIRYQNEFSLYYASVLRRDGNMVIKKKCQGGEENGGTYYDLSAYKEIATPKKIETRVTTRSNGTVLIEILSDGKVLLAGVDKGKECPIYKSGLTGIRGDNTEFYFSEFTVK